MSTEAVEVKKWKGAVKIFRQRDREEGNQGEEEVKVDRTTTFGSFLSHSSKRDDDRGSQVVSLWRRGWTTADEECFH